ncbi:MAG: nucleotide sugar dehydrogenase [Candidatus Desulforudis sp.]|nr:nucleotide sugar dehydrogenase [Desulforudis sp.]
MYSRPSHPQQENTHRALAYIGHEVHCIDQNPQVIESLSDGRVPIHEPGVKELLAMHLPLSFGGWDSFDPRSDVVFIAVGTPCKPNGDADLTYVEAVAAEIGQRMDEKPYLTVVVKSTVPLGSARRVESIITAALREREINTRLDVASNPEFLREGSALYDTFYPDRIVVGANKTFSANVLRELYTPILEQTFTHPAGVPRPQTNKLPVFITTTATSAELIKYAANAFLAMKISFINEFAGLAEHVGADITEVANINSSPCSRSSGAPPSASWASPLNHTPTTPGTPPFWPSPNAWSTSEPPSRRTTRWPSPPSNRSTQI